jgi:hypothetical protein
MAPASVRFPDEQAAILGALLNGRYIKAADAMKIGDVAMQASRRVSF